MKTIEIHGKKYVTVNERVKHFREEFKGWTIKYIFLVTSEMLPSIVVLQSTLIKYGNSDKAYE